MVILIDLIGVLSSVSATFSLQQKVLDLQRIHSCVFLNLQHFLQGPT